jgi:hypothetical protein
VDSSGPSGLRRLRGPTWGSEQVSWSGPAAFVPDPDQVIVDGRPQEEDLKGEEP